MDINVRKLLRYGSVCYIPGSNFDTVSQSMTWQGQALSELEPSEMLPGYFGWFVLPGLAQPTAAVNNPGLNITDETGSSV
jgi:hypothetical protein